MRYVSLLVLFSVVGCDEPYNLVEEQYFQQFDTEIEQRLRANTFREVVSATVSEPVLHRARSINFVEPSAEDPTAEETIVASFWESLLLGAGPLTVEVVEVVGEDFEPAASRYDNSKRSTEKISGVGLVGENLYEADVTEVDPLYRAWSKPNHRPHPVELSWWTEAAPPNPVDMKKHIAKYPLAENSTD